MMNLEPETRKGYYVSSEMKKVWAVELQLLKKLLEVCEKYHFRIFAEGGTLLGAVRENGFIPWDDDIDMAMPREDYDRLQGIAKEEFQAPFFFQSGNTDLFPNGLSRLRMDGTAAILPQSLFHDCHQGIFIDIFPLDVIPDDPKELDLFINAQIHKKRELYLFFKKHWSLSNIKYDWILFKSKLKIWTIGFNSAFHAYDQFIKQYAKSNNQYVSLISWNYDERYRRKRVWYNETIYIQFEDINLPVPADYDEVLTQQYGDYMIPVKAPTMHGLYGGFLVLDTEKSYKDYLSDLRRNKKRGPWEDLKKRFYDFMHSKK